MACPWGGDAHSAREPDAAVHDQQLAVRSVVHARQMRPMRRVKAPDLNARSGHLIDHRRVHPGTAQPVQQDVALHPASCGTGQRARKLLADGARPVDAGLEGDRVLCIVDGLEHRREDLVTVQQDFCRISVDERRAQQHPELAGELRIIECMESLHLPRDLCSVARDIQGVRCTGPGAVAQGFGCCKASPQRGPGPWPNCSPRLIVLGLLHCSNFACIARVPGLTCDPCCTATFHVQRFADQPSGALHDPIR